MQPMYKHDCEACKFVGHLKLDDGREVDMYLKCYREPYLSSTWYILRYSDEAPDYSTVPPLNLLGYLTEDGIDEVNKVRARLE